MQFSFAFPLFLYTPGSEAPKIFLFWISFDGYFPIIWIYLSISCLWNFWPILDSADQLCHQPRNDETAGQTCENDENAGVIWLYWIETFLELSQIVSTWDFCESSTFHNLNFLSAHQKFVRWLEYHWTTNHSKFVQVKYFCNEVNWLRRQVVTGADNLSERYWPLAVEGWPPLIWLVAACPLRVPAAVAPPSDVERPPDSAIIHVNSHELFVWHVTCLRC